ncbi:hypothetical protein [Synechocystis salina]|uniref:Uncharacterized protein n=1 Tax=Synechocystis salina LEGE 00031 TaxID=1828736 RepID=A0ABR9VUM7_9SYNC|nr:hypothetical protein [Synechocystis salina]MBE9241862.1 hypothetical protein [Synechocystis salina LEGE 00041]MBE9255070.1 hypothetical protein [Synechocystis salina LEGE 00031]
MDIPPSGARLQVFSRQPAIDLATLIEVLTAVVSNIENNNLVLTSDNKNPQQRQFIKFDSNRKRLRICTSGVLRRLFSSAKFRNVFKVNSQEQKTGFVQDFTPPRLGEIARLGGRLAADNQKRLPKLLDRLSAEIDQAIEVSGLTDATLLSLLLTDTETQLTTLGDRLGAKLPGKDEPQGATIRSVVFQPQSDQSSSSEKPVAKVISALEQVDAQDYFQKLMGAIATYLEQEEKDEDDIEAALDSLQKEREGNDSQIRRFINFLENEALARVRLNITFGIMAEIAAISRQRPYGNRGGLVDYVDRVLGVVALGQTESLAVDLSGYFGTGCQFTLNEYLNQALFFGCLAVWPEAKAQIFEEKTMMETGEVVQREVTYRFRVNGKNPDTGKTAYESRLDRIRQTLMDALDSSQSQGVKTHQINRNLAQLLFLDSVIPSAFPTEDNPLEDFDGQAWLKQFRDRLAWLSAPDGLGIQGKIEVLIAGLRDKKNLVMGLATALMTLVRTQDNGLLEKIKQRSSRQFIEVQRSIINWDRLESEQTSGLLRGSGGAEQVEWFKHLTIGDRPQTLNLFSVEVKTYLSGHNLVFQNTPSVTLQAKRVFSPKLLQILWVPHETVESQTKEGQKTWNYQPTAIAKDAKIWALEAAIQVEYEARTLERSVKGKQSNLSSDDYETRAQYHAAGIVAFEVLVYVTLWRIIQRLKSLTPEMFTALMVRIQNKADDSRDFTSGETYVYAAAQSLETVLNQDISLRMQGFVLENLKKSGSSYIQQGSFRALLSAFPLQLSTPTPPHLAKIGMITYATRPCDDYPQREQGLNYHLLVSKSYLATAIAEPFSGYQIQAFRTDVDILNLGDQNRQPRLIKEAIYQLQQQGCEHILLIAHSYGGRKLNRTAPQTNFLIQPNFLEDVFQTFPELTLYPLVKDEFPATRLYQRPPNEAGFEINRAEHHGDLWRSPRGSMSSLERKTVRDLIPAYTFATLAVVGKMYDQRPQSGFCTYFLLSEERVSNRAWTERARQHLLNADGSSLLQPGLISVLRGVHFLEAEKLDNRGILPILNPYGWITPTTKEAAGDVEILSSRRRGNTLLSYPAILSHLSSVLHR